MRRTSLEPNQLHQDELRRNLSAFVTLESAVPEIRDMTPQ